jgi:hypothetical protein
MQGEHVSRLQLAINVAYLDEAVDFYSKYFRTAPAKVRPGYANFAIDTPPLKLVLMEGGEPGTINHFGVEVFSTEEVSDATTYLAQSGFATSVEEHTTCCYAVQDKVWVDGPDGTKWETYVVLEDAGEPSSGEGCCTTDASAARCC